MWDIFSIYYTKQTQKNHYPSKSTGSVKVLSESLDTPMVY